MADDLAVLVQRIDKVLATRRSETLQNVRRRVLACGVASMTTHEKRLLKLLEKMVSR
jgi:hypothetical protein